MDNASGTQIDSRVLGVIYDSLGLYGNPSSTHGIGRELKTKLEKARGDVAAFINAKPKEVTFFSSATEANNTCLKGFAYANSDKGKHILSSPIEHASVYRTLEHLRTQGYEIEFLRVDGKGLIDIDDLKSKIREDTIAVTAIFGSNEVSTVQDISAISEVTRSCGVVFHTDATQAAGVCDIDVAGMGIDMLTFSGHKQLYAGKGAGALYCKEGIKVAPLVHGGSQEHGMRGGTEDVVSICALAEGCNISSNAARFALRTQLHAQKTELILRLSDSIPGTIINGCYGIPDSLPHIVNISFEGVNSEALQLMMDSSGILIGGGSACSVKSGEPSRILLAMGASAGQSLSSVRFSFSKYNSPGDVFCTAESLRGAVGKLRALNPCYGGGAV